MSTQIHDLGYRAFEGERAGVRWAVQSLAVHSMRRALGLKRAGKHKIAPLITIALAFSPALIMAGIAAFTGSEFATELISYAEYFGFILFALILFAATVAPGVLTTDRTSGMLALYLASPLNRTTYVLAKAIGLFVVMLIVTLGPIVFLILAYTFAGVGPDGVFAFVELFARATVAGALAAAFFTGLGMFVSSLPKRWAVASVSILGFWLVSSGVVAILLDADVTEWVGLLAPVDVMYEAWQRILDNPIADTVALDERSSLFVIGAVMAYVFALLAATWWRYQTVEVER